MPTWIRRGYGTNVGETVKGERLTHVAFADDMTIIARSWTSLKRMLSQLRAALAKRGLKLHPTKCKVQTNRPDCSERGNVAVDPDFSINILPEGEAIKVLGTLLDVHDPTKTEILNRISTEWRMFWGMSRLLLNRRISVKRRMRLFNSTVCSCVLWCTQSWTPRAEELRALQSAENKMLRRILGTGRAPNEEWVDWIRRVTRKAKSLAQSCGVRVWTQAHPESKWLWVGHVARRPTSTWVWRVTKWRDSEWQHMAEEMGSRLLRPSRRRWMKWEDGIRRHCADIGWSNWQEKAQLRDEWKNHAKGFSNHETEG